MLTDKVFECIGRNIAPQLCKIQLNPYFFCHKCDVYILPICLLLSYCKDKALDFTIKVAVLRRTDNIIGNFLIISEVRKLCRELDISRAVTLQCVSVSALKCSPESTRKHRQYRTQRASSLMSSTSPVPISPIVSSPTFVEEYRY